MHDSDDAAQYSAMRSGRADALAIRIATVRELVGLLAISPATAPQEDFQPTADVLAMLCGRLGRLLAQAGMSDCVRTLANLEPAFANLPSDEAFRDIDAALTYLSARVRDVALPPAATTTPSAMETPFDADTVTEPVVTDNPATAEEPAITDYLAAIDEPTVILEP